MDSQWCANVYNNSCNSVGSSKESLQQECDIPAPLCENRIASEWFRGMPAISANGSPAIQPNTNIDLKFETSPDPIRSFVRSFSDGASMLTLSTSIGTSSSSCVLNSTASSCPRFKQSNTLSPAKNYESPSTRLATMSSLRNTTQDIRIPTEVEQDKNLRFSGLSFEADDEFSLLVAATASALLAPELKALLSPSDGYHACAAPPVGNSECPVEPNYETLSCFPSFKLDTPSTKTTHYDMATPTTATTGNASTIQFSSDSDLFYGSNSFSLAPQSEPLEALPSSQHNSSLSVLRFGTISKNCPLSQEQSELPRAGSLSQNFPSIDFPWINSCDQNFTNYPEINKSCKTDSQAENEEYTNYLHSVLSQQSQLESIDRRCLSKTTKDGSSIPYLQGNQIINPSAFLFNRGVGGRHFFPPIVLAHPEEFRNPSSFLKVYGDPLCGLEGKVSSSESAILGKFPINGRNGNWVCPECQNINYPRRFRCNKCNENRDAAGDAAVSEYALRVYQHHLKTYRKLVWAEKSTVDSGSKPSPNGSSPSQVLPFSKPKERQTKSFQHKAKDITGNPLELSAKSRFSNLQYQQISGKSTSPFLNRSKSGLSKFPACETDGIRARPGNQTESKM